MAYNLCTIQVSLKNHHVIMLPIFSGSQIRNLQKFVDIWCLSKFSLLTSLDNATNFWRFLCCFRGSSEFIISCITDSEWQQPFWSVAWDVSTLAPPNYHTLPILTSRSVYSHPVGLHSITSTKSMMDLLLIHQLLL